MLLFPATASGAVKDIDVKSAALLKEWKGRFDAEGFAYVASGPFVIAGDGGVEKIARYRDGTILAADRALKAMYFTKRPPEPILILLFEKSGPVQTAGEEVV